MITKGIIRKKVLETLEMAQGYGCTENMVHEGVNNMVPGEVDLSDLRAAIEWCHGKAYLRTEVSELTEEREIYLTKSGKAYLNTL